LCKDIGEALGCGGCMAALRRISAGAYTEENAVKLDELVATENPESYLQSVDSMFAEYPKIVLTANQEKRCRNGNSFTVFLAEGNYRAYSASGEFLMLAKVENGIMATIKSFFEV
jgi:tRNA pseudouridine55 synthase